MTGTTGVKPEIRRSHFGRVARDFGRPNPFPNGRVLAMLSLAMGLGEVGTLVGCGGDSGVGPRTERDEFGLITCSEGTPTTTCHTHRSVLGVSMGAHGAATLALTRPDLFDAVGMLGVPLLDWVYMLRNIERAYLGGFCDYATLVGNIDHLHDPNGPAACPPAPAEVKITPDGRILEPVQSYNHWYRTTDTGQGGNFGRNKLRESFQDIALAFGNPAYFNSESPYFPAGVPLDFRARSDAERCAYPVILNGFRDARFNPDGSYPVITVCDTDTDGGDFLVERPAERATEILLAVDYNRNGIRDYAEPIIYAAHEPFSDEGTSINDVFDWDTNPTGRAKNGIYDMGEPFEDVGLDGVEDTNDYGENNGVFDYNPNVQRFLETNPRALIERIPEGHLERLSLWADAGIRDVLASAPATNWFWSSLVGRVGAGTARTYDDFDALKAPGDERFDLLHVDFSAPSIGQHVYVRYGNPDATPQQISRGDGHHVGSPPQVLDRFLSGVAFAESRMQIRDLRRVEVSGTSSLIQPRTFHSEALDEDRRYGLVLPPGYFETENAERRYPVLYLLHGQGQESDSLLASAILFFGYMADSVDEARVRRQESDWTKFILVFPDSTCSRGNCSSGTFNANHRGVDGHGPRYLDSLFELMAHIEANYRTAVPEVVAKD